jgi:hypothetical protein
MPAAPLSDKIEIPHQLVVLNGSFLDENNPEDVYRLLPCPEADEEWDYIGRAEFVMISKEEIVELGKDTSQVV